MIILILGLAFSTADNTDISVGYVAPGESQITNDIINLLNEKYLTKEHVLKELCVDELEQGLLHACIIFPDNMDIKNNQSNNIVFVVDKSRISLVYSVIEKVSGIVGLKTDELSKSLTNKLTDTLSSNNEKLDEILALTIKIKGSATDSSTKVDSIKNQINNMKLSDINSGMGTISSSSKELTEAVKDLSDIIEDETDNCYAYIDELRDFSSDGNYTATLDDLEASLDNLTYDANNITDTSDDSVSAIEDKIDSLESKIKSAKDISDAQITSLNGLKSSMKTLVTDIESLKTLVVNMQNSINTIEVKSSDQIVEPITTTIETISGDQNKLALIFPYALMLIIMFSCLLLSSTLVIVEKQSKAAFRTFTTPTKDEFFILTTYITSLIIIMIQIIIILAVVSYFLTNLILTNLLVNSIILILGMSLFVVLGMALGYSLKSQQATNMATISVGAIMLFISNIIFPLESIAPWLKNIAKYNPFVMTSEMLRRSILFQTELTKIMDQIGILLLYSVVLVIFIIFIQKVSKSKYFNTNMKARGKVNKFTKNSIRIEGELVKEKHKLIKVLKIISDEEYAKLIQDNEKEFISFLETLKYKTKSLKTLSRENLINELEKTKTVASKHLKKQEKENLKLKKKEEDKEKRKIKRASKKKKLEEKKKILEEQKLETKKHQKQKNKITKMIEQLEKYEEEEEEGSLNYLRENDKNQN